MDKEGFVKDMMSIGVLSYKEGEKLSQIAQRCAASAGISMGAVGALLGAKGGTVMVPGYGTVSGALVGALAGMVGGTVSCIALNRGARSELQKLASQASGL
jgi:hypothetical protein